MIISTQLIKSTYISNIDQEVLSIKGRRHGHLLPGRDNQCVATVNVSLTPVPVSPPAPPIQDVQSISVYSLTGHPVPSAAGGIVSP